MKKSCDKVPKHQTIKKYNQVRNAVKNEKKIWKNNFKQKMCRCRMQRPSLNDVTKEWTLHYVII